LRPSLHYSNSSARDVEIVAGVVGYSVIGAFKDNPRNRGMNTHHIYREFIIIKIKN
jgi:hypothetical protein